MADKVQEPIDDDELDDGPILLDPSANCGNCHYSILQEAPGQIQRVRVCRRMPPIPLLVPQQTQRGTALTLTCQHPIVADVNVCFEHDFREGEELPGLDLAGIGQG